MVCIPSASGNMSLLSLQSDPNDPNGPDIDTKIDELKQTIRRSEVRHYVHPESENLVAQLSAQVSSGIITVGKTRCPVSYLL